MKDLFGNTITEKDYEPVRKTLKNTMLRNYRKSTDKAVRCKTCLNIKICDYHSKRYYKCILLGFSHGEATDIRVNNVCDYYKDKQNEE